MLSIKLMLHKPHTHTHKGHENQMTNKYGERSPTSETTNQ